LMLCRVPTLLTNYTMLGKLKKHKRSSLFLPKRQ
jgi:hypothetical protein